MNAPHEDPRFAAAIALIGRTGAKSTQIRYSDDEQPVVWMAVAEYPRGRWDAAAGRDPLTAVLRLCETLMDGGTCAHCGRPTGFDADDQDFDQLGTDAIICWTQWDPELKTFRRHCKGS